jgi:predicted N-formylglutamate amidohydrolase
MAGMTGPTQAQPSPPDRIDWPAVEVVAPLAQGPAVLVCEHASPFVPPELPLGLAARDALSHAAWDPGAALVARRMAARLGAPLVAGALSRLVYDCNRPPDAPDAMPARSERIEIPGNRGLTPAQRRARAWAVHDPFHATLADLLARRPGAALVSVHSFTPVYDGAPREVEVGLLCEGGGGRLPRAMLPLVAARWRAALDRPYSAEDGVTYTLRRHGRGRDAAMIEIRNDLIATPEAARDMGDALATVLGQALGRLSAAA